MILVIKGTSIVISLFHNILHANIVIIHFACFLGPPFCAKAVFSFPSFTALHLPEQHQDTGLFFLKVCGMSPAFGKPIPLSAFRMCCWEPTGHLQSKNHAT